MENLATFTVETRPFPDLVKIINNHLKFLPDDVDLFILYGNETQYLKSFFPKANFIKLKEPFDLRSYNELLTSTKLWSAFLDYRKVLCFQSDSMILRPGIEEFLEMSYGYMGAPFWFQQWGANGGCSLRDPKLMYEICSKYRWNGYENEDIYFSNILNKDYNDRLAPFDICKKWGVESVFTLGSLTMHSPQTWLTEKEVLQIKNQYNG